MSKELTPLAALNHLRNGGLVKDDIVCFTKKAFENRLDIIETAFKRLEELNSLYTLTNHNGKFYVVIDKTEFNQILKKLEALEIIKAKGIKAVKYFTKYYLVDKNNNLLCEISKKEYELLKEILK